MRRVVNAFRESAGAGKPMFLQAAVSFARTDEDASAALDQWKHSALRADQLADLTSPAAFDHAAAHVDLRDVQSKIRVSSDIDRQLEWLHEDYELGFERVYLHNVARDHQERFIKICAERIVPSFNQSDTDRSVR
jgi:hypothetical protein